MVKTRIKATIKTTTVALMALPLLPAPVRFCNLVKTQVLAPKDTKKASSRELTDYPPAEAWQLGRPAPV